MMEVEGRAVEGVEVAGEVDEVVSGEDMTRDEIAGEEVAGEEEEE